MVATLVSQRVGLRRVGICRQTKAVHLMVTYRCTSTLGSRVPHPIRPISLWNIKYDTSHEVTTIGGVRLQCLNRIISVPDLPVGGLPTSYQYSF